MEYNDFKILSNEQYDMLNKQYVINENIEMDILNNLFLNFDQCKSFCFGLSNKVNKQIQQALNNARQEYDKLINNLNLTFNITAHTPQTIQSFNLFSFAKKVVEGLILVQQLCFVSANKKISNFVCATTKTILEILSNLFSALEKSNIHLFKYM